MVPLIKLVSTEFVPNWDQGTEVNLGNWIWSSSEIGYSVVSYKFQSGIEGGKLCMFVNH